MAALQRIGWRVDRQTGSHRTLEREVDPENWTGRIVRPNSGERFQCRRRDEYTVPSLKPKLGLML
ncbi:MAG: type II toxin-antitoxin system HicA family toxin [Opitutaceae bacterium]|nr:type II toxin-antitoxin system HicA family toxin [Opitutaceae bacterium]